MKLPAETKKYMNERKTHTQRAKKGGGENEVEIKIAKVAQENDCEGCLLQSNQLNRKQVLI